MTKQQAEAIIEILNVGWAQHPIPPSTAAVWSAALSDSDFERCRNAALLLVRTRMHRPPIAEVIATAAPSEAQETAHEAYQAVLGVMWRPVADRAEHISERALAAVMRLGGWATVGAWDLDKGTWNFRDFREAYEDTTDRLADHARRAIVSGGSEAIGGSVLALAQAKRLKGGK